MPIIGRLADRTSTRCRIAPVTERRRCCIPVRYDGPDLDEVAATDRPEPVRGDRPAHRRRRGGRRSSDSRRDSPTWSAAIRPLDVPRRARVPDERPGGSGRAGRRVQRGVSGRVAGRLAADRQHRRAAVGRRPGPARADPARSWVRFVDAAGSDSAAGSDEPAGSDQAGRSHGAGESGGDPAAAGQTVHRSISTTASTATYLEVIRPGPLSLFQDAGRAGMRLSASASPVPRTVRRTCRRIVCWAMTTAPRSSNASSGGWRCRPTATSSSR